MKGNWKDLFSFNSRERNGIFVLATLIVLVICVQIAMPFFISNEVEIDTTIIDKYVAQLKLDSANWVRNNQARYREKYAEKNSFATIDSVNNSHRKPTIVNYDKTNKVKEKLHPHPFNPNIATMDDWKSVGLNKGQIKSINNYLDKGGQFRKIKDVQKMYVINDQQFLKMEPYLVIPVDTAKRVVASKKWSSRPDTAKTVKPHYIVDSFSIEINSADTSDLKRLKGIGSYYARQIVYYRDKLGGYHNLAQLYEIERMRESTVLNILPFLKLDSSLIRKIHINKDIAPDMVKHPYITWNMAIQIQDYRDFSHKFKSVDDLVQKGLLNEELYSKLAPYIEL
tara:strand:- start:44923 stop:45939 length:1017 start_codon:yes stop_codon:yes gene_type:complete